MPVIPALRDRLVSTAGAEYTAIAASAIAAANVVVSGFPGRLCKVIVNVALTSGQSVTFYDNATTNSGNIVFVTAAAAAIGTVYDLQIPCYNGITIAKNTSLAAGAIIVTWE